MGLSGGVDSAVSAALLKKEGCDVTGVFIKAWTPPYKGYPCIWKEDRRSAMKAAAVLDIPFITLDLEKEYKKEVVDYMITEYKKGRTPNPDVMCNKEIKFGHFLKFALANGAQYVATGHYARKSSPPTGVPTKLGVAETPLSLARRGGLGGEVVLLEGADKNKDQSYFLWTITQNQLKHILFPIGHLQKSEVRKLAEKFGLPQATRKDSHGLCFLGQINMKEFLKKHIGTKKGSVLNKDEGKIGEHEGAILYTMGERHGFYVNNKKTRSEPLYVISKNLNKNTITVAPKITPHPKLTMTAIVSLNWILDKIPDQNKEYSCRVRYRQEKQKCKIKIGKNRLKVIFDKPQFSISPGQSLVVYDNEECLGGGIIDSTSSL